VRRPAPPRVPLLPTPNDIGPSGTNRFVHLAFLAAALVLASPGRAPACRDFAQAPGARWRLVSRHGVDWLVTPCGDLFFSVGLNTLDGGAPAPEVGGRTAYYWGSFYPSLDAWSVTTRARATAWGFNTAGATSLSPDVLALPAIPDLELGRSARFHWVDPFDPATDERMRVAARRLVAPYAHSPFRIGYFSDNEVGWWNGALFAFYLEKAEMNHTKQRLVALLREAYGDDWERFAADFIPPPGVASFADLLRHEGAAPHLRPGGSGIQVVRRWTGIVAERYYHLAHDALRAADPDALLFGDRLPIYYDPAAVRAMAPWVDAIATNYNVDSPDGWIARYYFDGLRALSGGKPILVSEWFFAANENRTGNRNNGHLMTVATQAERARGAAAAAARFGREPEIIGAHWFQYYDHPRGGRDDGEDYNFGLVDVDDRPYGRLVTALGEVNARLAALHRDARPAPPPRAELPEASIDPRDRSLADWPKERALVALEAPAPEVVFGDLYAAWDREGLSLAAIAMDYYAPELLAADQDLPLAECFHVDWGIDAGHGPRRFTLYVVPPRVVPSPAARYEMRPVLCRTDGDRCTPVPAAVVTYFGADQPRITAEVRIPWKALGVEGSPPRALRMELAATAFHRARWMSTSGEPPAAALARPAGWRRVTLQPRFAPKRSQCVTRSAGRRRPTRNGRTGRPIGTRATIS